MMNTAYVCALAAIWLSVVFGLRHSVSTMRTGAALTGVPRANVNRKAMLFVVFCISTSSGMTYVMTQIYFLHQSTVQLAVNG